MQDLLNQISPIQIIGVVFVILFIVKKLIKWAVILGALFIVVVPYLDNNGYLDTIKNQIGL
ncbi:MAG: hypothetical protein WCO64_08230 [Actinomycetes bacterium]